MQKPLYTADKYTLRAYLEDGRTLEIPARTGGPDSWPAIYLDAQPVFMARQPTSTEVEVDRSVFETAYSAVMQQFIAAALVALPAPQALPRPYEVVAIVEAPDKDLFGHTDDEYVRQPGWQSIAQQRDLATDAQKDEIRALLGGKLSLEVATRFDARSANAYTQPEAAEFIAQLRTSSTNEAA